MPHRTCINCDASLDEGFERTGNLSALGYLHEDVWVDCPECGKSHVFGIPENGDVTEPPECPVCGGRRYPYKCNRDGDPGLRNVHWKCEDCYYFETKEPTRRDGSVTYFGVHHLEGSWDE